MKKSNDRLWGIILAAGEGQRLREFLSLKYGSTRPKQFSTIIGTRSMLRHTIARTERIINPKNVLTVVCKPHLEYVLQELTKQEKRRMVVLPCSRETAPSILVALLCVKHQNPDATVVILPSDHFVAEEDRFLKYIEGAVGFVTLYPEQVVLLGVKPLSPDPDYGWIEVTKNYLTSQGGRYYTVRQFVEKPATSEALQLYNRGALWNSMVTIAKVATLERLFRKHTPELFKYLERWKPVLENDDPILEAAFEKMPSRNFSVHLLERAIKVLRVVRIDGVYWSDWGNTDRIIFDLMRLGLGP
jgi:mannose-1-phosphate guanylyltransferase